MWLLWIVLIVSVIIVALNLANRGVNETSGNKESPLDILKKRYANGEIDTEEYERRRNEISNK